MVGNINRSLQMGKKLSSKINTQPTLGNQVIVGTVVAKMGYMWI